MKNVAIISCSNGLQESARPTLDKLLKIFSSLGLNVVLSSTIYVKDDGLSSGSGKERGEELMNLYKDSSIDAIFDVSGGDLSNEVLEYIDFDVIKNNPKPFIGYSDLSVILNSIYSQSGAPSYLYQVRHIVTNEENLNRFTNFIKGLNNDLFNFKYNWIQGKSMEGIVIGGNIRCTLKLAGTKYMPDFKGKILLLESLGGDVAKMRTFLTQLKLMGAFKEINGIILGTFTEMEKNNYNPTIEELVKEIVNDKNMPIVKTKELGHGNDSKCIVIGKEIKLVNN
ncbi:MULTISPECIES: S66 family peptidase [Clostridium]|jgi:muramoyltetrapeptide carboxypeptidase|uniref:S66 family peptidase n=1 Tax=Clostridium TaxID=1485 RepID=UPI000DCF65FB|nr:MULTISPECIES: S66 peptidase family protein [Clostridium]MDU3323669.1 LD-carboxypeptidase [Escherichia coli]MBS7129870.1 LD-carboxypeptidase [Clostridium sp.]MDB2076115.1 LD-carboxypeptidase [Clostridium paraputrificum]MDB2079427.1 LD-carboxypeptidase [Clostridium paraputrificum]MDB2084352.1 LD-carboxypeptidase [Clostridium paraputrificum]